MCYNLLRSAMEVTNRELPNRVQPDIPRSSSLETRSIPFLVGLGLFGLGLASALNILDPFIYTEKTRLLAPPALKNTTLSLITITTLLVAFLVQPLVGRWSDRTQTRWGRRNPFLLGGVIGLSLALALVVAADSLWLLILAVILVSISSNTLQGPWQALVPDRVPVSQHGTMAGIKTIMESIGVVIGVGLVGLTVAQGNLWAAPLAVISFFWLILWLTILTLRQAPAASGVTTSLRFASPLALFKLNLSHLPPAFPWWMVNRCLFWAAAIAIRTFLLNYMEDVLKLSPAETQALSSRILVLLGAGVFLLVLPAGAIADRIGRRPLLIVAGLLAAAGATLFIFLQDINLLFIAGGLIAGGAGIFASASWALATDIVPKNEGALYLGLANAATVLGSIGGRLGGPLIDGLNQLTGTTTLGYLAVFGLATLFFLGSSVAVLKIKER
ncbi:MAG: MFS transporter [Chloroflexi bacterium]|nr:MFS transporter [Chloroflexota bacterium]